MRPFDTLIRLSEQTLDDKRKRLAQLESLLAAARKRRQDLDRELAEEQKRAAESAEAGFGYGAYAREMIRRRERADAHVAKAEADVAEMHEEVRDAFAELKRYEKAHEARLAARDAEQARKDLAAQDETAQNLARRKGDRL